MTVFVDQRGNTREFHTKECIKVTDSFDSMAPKESKAAIEKSDISECELCKLSVTEHPDRYDGVALDLFERYLEKLENGNTISAYNDRDEMIGKSFRHLISQTQSEIQESGYLDEYVGVSVNNLSHWKSQRPTVNLRKYDNLIFDAIVVNLLFDIFLYDRSSYDSLSSYLAEYATKSQAGSKTCHNVAKTMNWLVEDTTVETPDRLDDLIAEFTPSLIKNTLPDTETEQSSTADKQEDPEPASETKPTAGQDSEIGSTQAKQTSIAEHF